MNNKRERTFYTFLEISIPLITILVFAGSLFMSWNVEVHAQELPSEDYTQTDLEQDERLNALEVRLEELGYRIDDINGILEQIQADMSEDDIERLAISEKLDLVIIALNDIINHDIEYLEKTDTQELAAEEYRTLVQSELAALNQTSSQQFETTVSGNGLMSNLDTTLKANNEETQKSYEESTVLILLFLAVLGGLIAGSILSRYIKND